MRRFAIVALNALINTGFAHPRSSANYWRKPTMRYFRIAAGRACKEPINAHVLQHASFVFAMLFMLVLSVIGATHPAQAVGDAGGGTGGNCGNGSPHGTTGSSFCIWSAPEISIGQRVALTDRYGNRKEIIEANTVLWAAGENAPKGKIAVCRKIAGKFSVYYINDKYIKNPSGHRDEWIISVAHSYNVNSTCDAFNKGGKMVHIIHREADQDRIFDYSITVDPSLRLPTTWLGGLQLVERGDYEEAAGVLAQAAMIDETDWRITYLSALAQASLGFPYQAEQLMQAACDGGAPKELNACSRADKIDVRAALAQFRKVVRLR